MSQRVAPPRVPLNFFRWYCDPKMKDYIEGDLLEAYQAIENVRQRKSGHAVLHGCTAALPARYHPVKKRIYKSK